MDRKTGNNKKKQFIHRRCLLLLRCWLCGTLFLFHHFFATIANRSSLYCVCDGLGGLMGLMLLPLLSERCSTKSYLTCFCRLLFIHFSPFIQWAHVVCVCLAKVYERSRACASIKFIQNALEYALCAKKKETNVAAITITTSAVIGRGSSSSSSGAVRTIWMSSNMR